MLKKKSKASKKKKSLITSVAILWPILAILIIEMMKPRFNDPSLIFGLIVISLFGFVLVRAIKGEDDLTVLKDFTLLIICSLLVSFSIGVSMYFNFFQSYSFAWIIFSIAIIFIGYRFFFGKKK